MCVTLDFLLCYCYIEHAYLKIDVSRAKMASLCDTFCLICSALPAFYFLFVCTYDYIAHAHFWQHNSSLSEKAISCMFYQIQTDTCKSTRVIFLSSFLLLLFQSCFIFNIKYHQNLYKINYFCKVGQDLVCSLGWQFILEMQLVYLDIGYVVFLQFFFLKGQAFENIIQLSALCRWIGAKVQLSFTYRIPGSVCLFFFLLRLWLWGCSVLRIRSVEAFVASCG